MATVLHFLQDPYRWECRAKVQEVHGNMVVVDETVFYPGIGVSAADTGILIRASGQELAINEGRWIGPGQDRLGHLVEPAVNSLKIGEPVIIRVDKARRLHQMRVHTALHLAAVGFPFSMIGGSVGPGEGYVDFLVDRTGMSLSILQNQIDRLVAQQVSVLTLWVDRSRGLVDERAAEFRWPGHPNLVRVVKIGSLSTHLCDGLHVANTAEVGPVTVTNFFPIESRRLRVSVSVMQRRGSPFLAFNGTRETESL